MNEIIINLHNIQEFSSISDIANAILSDINQFIKDIFSKEIKYTCIHNELLKVQEELKKLDMKYGFGHTPQKTKLKDTFFNFVKTESFTSSENVKDCYQFSTGYNPFLYTLLKAAVTQIQLKIIIESSVVGVDYGMLYKKDGKFYSIKNDIEIENEKFIDLGINIIIPELILEKCKRITEEEQELKKIKATENKQSEIQQKQEDTPNKKITPKKKIKTVPKTEIDLSKLSQNERIIYELNDAQKTAATYKNENLLILAGAGCGKTKTIIARTAYLISQGHSPDRIKILTFTKKAAFEITQRVDNLLDSNSYVLGASTFHRWCIDLIKNTPEVFGFKGFSIIDRDDQLQIFKKLRADISALHLFCGVINRMKSQYLNFSVRI